MSAAPALLPCPLCRSPHVNLARDLNGVPERVFCKVCDCCAPIAAWNRRPAPAPGLEEAVEVARRIERERYIGSQFVADARKVARALLSLTRGDGRELGAATRASEGPTAPIIDRNPKE